MDMQMLAEMVAVLSDSGASINIFVIGDSDAEEQHEEDTSTEYSDFLTQELFTGGLSAGGSSSSGGAPDSAILLGAATP